MGLAQQQRRPSGRSGAVAGPRSLALALGAAAALAPEAAGAFDLGPAFHLPSILDPRSAVGFAIFMGLMIFATTLAIFYLRERQRWTDAERALSGEVAELRARAERADLLLGAERQIIVVWTGQGGEPAFEGDPSVVAEGATVRRVLAFGSWLLPVDAARLEAALTRLRQRGEAFLLTLAKQNGFVDAQGRTTGGRALLRLRDVTGDRAALLTAGAAASRAETEAATLRNLLDAIGQPVWLRRPDGSLAWANRAYCAAVEASDSATAASRSLELLDKSDREAARARRAAGQPYQARVAAVVAGSRRLLDVTEVSLDGRGGADGAAVPAAAGGMALDVSDLEAVRADLNLQMQAHVRMLDQLPTAVAMFDSGKRLLFHNAAYRQLWGLDPVFLETRPSDGEILDRLREARKLPEQADYRSWKAGIQEGYRAVEPQETWWHLPDRRTLRVVITPAPQGGLTYLFDDVSDRVGLESRYNALTRTQGETLDSLREGVALFGSDGRLKLHNRAFADLWRLESATLAGLHIDTVVEGCRGFAPAEAPWGDLSSAVSGLSEHRERLAVRMERLDGSVLDCAAEPMPDGATLLTFGDVTASVNVERALTERNDALEMAGRLRNDFVHHVSYELRSPLTTVIGFAELLGAETVGPLNERQREYADHITRSSGALLAIINDILDLASIDAETIELVREPVDILGTIEAAAAGIHDRLMEADLRLEIDAPGAIGSFSGDSKRVRQVLFNLLSNATEFSLPGGTIRVAARRHRGEVLLSVSDQGQGIPSEAQTRVFERFESRTSRSGHRGVGLGLSIVRSFVELHGGRVELVSEQGSGTTVTCFFPDEAPTMGQLAAGIPDDGRPA